MLVFQPTSGPAGPASAGLAGPDFPDQVRNLPDFLPDRTLLYILYTIYIYTFIVTRSLSIHILCIDYIYTHNIYMLYILYLL